MVSVYISFAFELAEIGGDQRDRLCSIDPMIMFTVLIDPEIALDDVCLLMWLIVLLFFV